MVNDALLAPDEVERILLRQWPAGVPVAERVLLASLESAIRDRVIRRLAAIQRVGRGASPTLEVAGLDLERVGFYKLRKRWAQEKTLAVLVPKAKRGSGRRKLDAEDVAVARSEGRSPSVETRLRIAREQRRAVALKPATLRENFGRRFALDLSFVDIPLALKSSEWAMAALMVELQSGLILAAKLDRSVEAAPTLERALLAAFDFAANEHVRVFVGEDGRPDIQAAVEYEGANPVEVMRFMNWIENWAGHDRVAAEGSRRFGGLIADTIGLALGRIRLRRRSPGPLVKAKARALQKWAPMSLEDAQALLDLEVASHNAKLRPRLRRLGLIGGSADGTLLRSGWRDPPRATINR